MTRPKISTLLRWLGTLVGIVLFVWLLARQDWMRALAALGAIPLWALMFSLALYALSYGFNTLRWCILLWAQNAVRPARSGQRPVEPTSAPSEFPCSR